jgi:RiboL-PSP-HEPN
MAGTIVDALYQSNRGVTEYLHAAGEISLSSTVDESFRKVLLLAAASYFEHMIKEVLLEFVTERAGADEAIVSLVRTKAVERQYHTYFRWDIRNANTFFAMFGEKFSSHMKSLVASDPKLKDSIEAFLELGELRN